MSYFEKKAIGNTPYREIVKLNDCKARIFAKIESENPFGSIKDRVAFEMIEDAQSKGLIKKSGTIIEATSGKIGWEVVEDLYFVQKENKK